MSLTIKGFILNCFGSMNLVSPEFFKVCKFRIKSDSLFFVKIHNSNLSCKHPNLIYGSTFLSLLKAFKYLHDHHLQEFDWFLKADDDTYVIVENLRYFLSNEDPREPIYFGQRFKPFVKQGYASGGGGYVLSREALRRFGAEGYAKSSFCARDRGAEDIEMGRCLQNLGVHLKPSLDALGRTRFHCFTPERFIMGAVPKWFNSYDLDGIKAVGRRILDNILFSSIGILRCCQLISWLSVTVHVRNTVVNSLVHFWGFIFYYLFYNVSFTRCF